MSEEKYQSHYLTETYDIPDFVKNSPDYSALFEEEIEIVTDGKKWGCRYENSKYKVEYDFDTFFEAYFDTYRFDNRRAVFFSREIGKQIFGNPEQKDEDDENRNSNIGDMFYGKKVSNGYLHISNNRGDFWVKHLENDYQDWKEANAQLDENFFKPENLVEIYNWLNTHPDFWKQVKKEDRVNWETDNGVQALWSAPM